MTKATMLASTFAFALAMSPVLANARPAQLASSNGVAGAAVPNSVIMHPAVQDAKSKIYSFDDGSSENAVGFGNGTTNIPAIWFDNFKTVKGGEAVSAVEVAWGTPANTTTAAQLNGQKVTIALWSDPNQDGVPTDAVLIGSVKGVISAANTDKFVTYTFKAPVMIGPAGTSFFAGDVTPAVTTAEYFFEALDTTSSAVHSYVAANAAAGKKLNVKHPGKNDTVGTIDSFGLPGNWLIRAVGVK